MKRLLRFLLVAFLVSLSLFFALFLEVSFDEEPSLTAGWCPTHGLLAVRVVLPERLGECTGALSRLTDRLPRALTEPPRAVLRAVITLIYDVREIYRTETAGCTAFS